MDRDIVQFVAMRDFQTEIAMYQLPKAVLEEIPDQFMSYMQKHKILPRSRIRRRTLDLEVDARFIGIIDDEPLSEVNTRFVAIPNEPPPAYVEEKNQAKVNDDKKGKQ